MDCLEREGEGGREVKEVIEKRERKREWRKREIRESRGRREGRREGEDNSLQFVGILFNSFKV